MLDWIRKRWHRKRENANLVGAIYGSISQAARDPAFYTRFGVSDTLMGRYEMMALHSFLFQHRAKGSTPHLEDMAQEVLDAYFLELDHSLREVGIGDVAVPKRMKKLGRMIYGRWEAYGKALRENDRMSMTDALRRNVYSEGGDADRAADLAAYVFLASEHLARQDDSSILSGKLEFPAPYKAVEAA